jgi:PAS domain S-box-containing protein
MQIPSSQWDVALDDIGIGAAQVDPDRKWQKVNPQLLELPGYSSAEILALSFEEIFQVAQPEREAHDRRLLLNGKSRSYFADARALRKDGSSPMKQFSSPARPARAAAESSFV